MDLAGCSQMIQEYLSTPPLIVLGAGSSAAYGLPTMKDLADSIECHKAEFVDQQFVDFCTALSSKGLEKALDDSNLDESSKTKIRSIIWCRVNECDQAFMRTLKSSNEFPLAQLFKKLLSPTPSRINVITTNYDRLAEYASDLIHATSITGFEGSLIRYFEDEDSALIRKRIAARERTVNIIKVHGSLDWFKDGDTLLSYPFSKEIESGLQPVIIPPGREKYFETRDDPYRTLISKADTAFKAASCYLCIGYGFNDEHIQPILLREIRQNKPIVVLTKSMTQACKKHLSAPNIKKKVIIDECPPGKTMITYHNGENIVVDGTFWTLEGFLDSLY